MRATWLADVLDDAGLRVRTVSGWENRGANGPVRFFNPRGLVWHHTATSPRLSTASLLKLLINGRPDLPGPLAQSALERDGVYYVLASGKANHAGQGSWLDLKTNYDVMGIEPANDGRGEPWPSVQLDAYRRGSKAILDKLKTTSAYMPGHKEWAPSRKIDPFGLNMNWERRKVAEIGADLIIFPGESGHYVRPWQTALNNWARKQSVPGWTPLVENGVFGPATEAAVSRYQIAAQVEAKPEIVLGQLDGLTRDLLERFVESS